MRARTFEGKDCDGRHVRISGTAHRANQKGLDRAPCSGQWDLYDPSRKGDARGGTSPDRRGMVIARRTAARRRRTRRTRSVGGPSLPRQRGWAAGVRRNETAFSHWYPVAPGREHGLEGGIAERVNIKVRGVASDQRCESVCSALRFISGVADVAFDRTASEVTLTYDPHHARIEQFRVAIWAVGCRVDSLVFPDEHQGWHALRAEQDGVSSAARRPQTRSRHAVARQRAKPCGLAASSDARKAPQGSRAHCPDCGDVGRRRPRGQPSPDTRPLADRGRDARRALPAGGGLACALPHRLTTHGGRRSHGH